MRILFVQPQVHGKPSAPPLGIAYLASVARNMGHEVAMIDNEFEQFSEEILTEKISAFSPDILAITTIIMSRLKSLRIVDSVPNIPYVLFGGPQATLSPDFYIRKQNHYVMRGESEVILRNFLTALGKGETINDIRGLSWMNDEGKLVSNPAEPYISDIDTIPYPAYDLLPIGKYTHKFEGEPCATMIATRGCPYKCIYCYHILNSSFRTRSPANVIGEMKFLQEKYGFKSFKFFDDVFSLKKKHTMELCQAFIDEGLDIKWQILTRVNCVDEELLQMMYKAGLRHISFGIESGSQKTLDKIEKVTSVEKNRWALQKCREVGIRTKAYIIIGFPWETKEDIQETIRFVEETVPDAIQVLFATPMENTDIEKMIEDAGIHIDKEALYGLEDVPDLIVPSYETEHWTKEDLIDLYSELHDRYFAAGGAGGKNKIRPKGAMGRGRLDELLSPLEAVWDSNSLETLKINIRKNAVYSKLARRLNSGINSESS